MIDGGSIESEVGKVESVVEQIKKKVIEWHQEFDDGRAQKGESFHNQHHIEATIKAALSLVDKAKDGQDPLNINQDLKRWQQQNVDISPEEFREIIQLAFLFHDLGNIAHGVIEDDQGDDQRIRLNFFEDGKYRAGDAESRSIEIARELLNFYIKDQSKRDKYFSLIKHLINQTIFNQQGSSGELFNQFVQVVDQIGNSVFIGEDIRLKQVNGLLHEIKNEFPDATYVPDNFYNFFHRRFPVLVPDDGIREEIMSIWVKEAPYEINGLSKEKKLIDLDNLPVKN